jgi:hypothetical protein
VKENVKKIALLLGMGLDGDDGHKRVTKGKNFLLFGGSKETHEIMQDKACDFNSELDKRGKRLEEISREEFHEIAERIGIHAPADGRPEVEKQN